MSEFPSSWKTLPLSEVLTVRYGKDVPKELRSENGRYPVVGSAGVMTYTDIALTTAPAVLVGRKGNVGSVQLFLDGCHPVDTAYLLEVPHSVLPKFLKLQLDAKDLKGMDSSTAIPSLRRQDLEAVDLVIPPLDVQQRIVVALEDHLSRLDKALAEVENATSQVDTFADSYLQRMFEQDPNETLLGSDVKVVDCEHKTAPKAGSVIGGYSVGTSAVRRGNIDFDKAKPISQQTLDEWTKRATPMPGNLIFTREAPIGEVAIVPNDPKIALGQRTVLLQITTEKLLPEFLHVWLQSPQVRSWIRGNSTGTTVLHLNVADVKRLPLPLIPPVEAQRRMLDDYSVEMQKVTHAVANVSLAVEDLVGLRRSLLHAAFTGQLTNEESND